MNILHSALGNYESAGKPIDADIISGHSFGTSVNAGSPNHALARFAYKIADGRPIAVDRTLVAAFPRGEADVAFIVDGPISNTFGAGVGSWGTLAETKTYMERHNLVMPLLVAQAHHIGRVALQARKLEMDPVIPEDLPRDFDKESDQIWTRSLAMWVPREAVGSFVLKAQGKL